MNPTKNMKDMSTNELKNLLSTVEFMSKHNDNAKRVAIEIKKEIERRAL